MTATQSPAPSMQFAFPAHLQSLGVQNSDGYHQELLRGLTHKLNNLLAIIQGFSSLILMNEDLDPGVLENMQHIKEASVNITALSERIRAAGGCAKVNLQPLNLREYLGAIDTALREPFAKAGIAFEMHVAANVPPVSVDPTKLKELLIEILRNAAEAAQKTGGRAIMQITGPGQVTPLKDGRVDILISNTGSDIVPDKAAEIFRPFHGTKNSHHLGLGLAIATMLSHQMSCHLGVNSQGNTATFWVSVPMA